MVNACSMDGSCVCVCVLEVCENHSFFSLDSVCSVHELVQHKRNGFVFSSAEELAEHFKVRKCTIIIVPRCGLLQHLILSFYLTNHTDYVVVMFFVVVSPSSCQFPLRP